MKYFYFMMLLFSLICLFLAVSNSLPSWLAAIYAICFVEMIIKKIKKGEMKIWKKGKPRLN